MGPAMPTGAVNRSWSHGPEWRYRPSLVHVPVVPRYAVQVLNEPEPTTVLVLNHLSSTPVLPALVQAMTLPLEPRSWTSVPVLNKAMR